LLVVAMVVIAMALRPGISSIGPVLPLISREFSLSYAVASLLTTIPTLLMGLLALPTPWLARKLGRTSVLFASLVLLFVSMAAAYIRTERLDASADDGRRRIRHRHIGNAIRGNYQGYAVAPKAWTGIGRS
jgi:MFS family permease